MIFEQCFACNDISRGIYRRANVLTVSCVISLSLRDLSLHRAIDKSYSPNEISMQRSNISFPPGEYRYSLATYRFTTVKYSCSLAIYSDILLLIIEISLLGRDISPTKCYSKHKKLSYGTGNASNLCVRRVRLKQVQVTFVRSDWSVLFISNLKKRKVSSCVSDRTWIRIHKQRIADLIELFFSPSLCLSSRKEKFSLCAQCCRIWSLKKQNNV